MTDVHSDRQLPLRFDPLRLKADLALIRADEWAPHYNERDYGGEWKGVALRSLSGSPDQLAAHAADPDAFMDTPLDRRCAYFRDVLSVFHCPLKSVRLLSLAPRSFVREHSDPGFAADDRDVRLHIPVQTSDEVEFYLDGERLRLEEGRCYWIDVSRPHRLANDSKADRIHLVIDAEVNDWLRGLLGRGEAVERLPSRPMPFDEFRRRVIGDVELSRELAAIPEWDGMVDAVVRLGRRHGFSFEAADVRPPQHQRLERCPGGRPPGWLPAAVRVRDAAPAIEWAWFGSHRLTEPFFDDSLRAARRRPFARLFDHQTQLEASDEVRAPAGFIFHMSRCGSTLVARMFAALARVVVISEAPAIDDVIRAGHEIPGTSTDEHVRWLRAVVGALGRGRHGEDGCVVKLDAWHIHSLPLIRAAFPETPWIFLYRDPIDVMLSQLRSPGRFCLPGAIDPAFLGLDQDEMVRLRRDEWCARVLERIGQAALAQRDDPNGLLLNYRRLPDAVWSEVAGHFSIAVSPDDVARMREAARFDAKQPTDLFQPRASGDQARDNVPAGVRDLAAARLQPVYAALERRPRQTIETA